MIKKRLRKIWLEEATLVSNWKRYFEVPLVTISESNKYNQTNQSLRTWVQGDIPDVYNITIFAEKRLKSEHARRYSEPKCSEAAVIIVGAEYIEVETWDVSQKAKGNVVVV